MTDITATLIQLDCFRKYSIIIYIEAPAHHIVRSVVLWRLGWFTSSRTVGRHGREQLGETKFRKLKKQSKSKHGKCPQKHQVQLHSTCLGLSDNNALPQTSPSPARRKTKHTQTHTHISTRTAGAYLSGLSKESCSACDWHLSFSYFLSCTHITGKLQVWLCELCLAGGSRKAASKPWHINRHAGVFRVVCWNQGSCHHCCHRVIDATWWNCPILLDKVAAFRLQIRPNQNPDHKHDKDLCTCTNHTLSNNYQYRSIFQWYIMFYFVLVLFLYVLHFLHFWGMFDNNCLYNILGGL